MFWVWYLSSCWIQGHLWAGHVALVNPVRENVEAQKAADDIFSLWPIDFVKQIRRFACIDGMR